MKLKRYELLVDLYSCKLEFNKKNISKYIKKLCELINMKRHGKLILWEDSHNEIPELRGGISAFQFLKTSNITLHSFEKFKRVYIDIFSCKGFDFKKAANFSKEFFKADKARVRKISG